VSKKIRAILVDDEERARDVLGNLLNRFAPNIEIVDTCANVPAAVESIKKHHPDVLFLDIEMPMYAGYEIVSFFKSIDFQIVFVTAYDRYAIKAFEVSAVDYLLKPVEIDRLKQAIEKVEKNLALQNKQAAYQALSENLQTPPISKLVVRQNGMQKVVATNHILAIEAQEAYSCIHTTNGNYLMSKNLKHYENALEHNPNFFRSHKSWLVNLDHMQSFSKSKQCIQLAHGIEAKLSKYRLSEFEEVLKG
jgi:two-component system LytT family response regulator